MNTQANFAPTASVASRRNPVATKSSTQLLCWSIQRELWEYRSIYIAPLVVAAIYLFGYWLSLIWLPPQGVRENLIPSMRDITPLDAAHRLVPLAMPYAHAGMLTTFVAVLVAIFYSLDALYGERRDRSILFWKSLPVSDLITVLSKASIPLVILPLVVFAITVVVQLAMRLSSMAVLSLGSSGGAAILWRQLPLFEMQIVLLYGLVVMALWLAPIYAWLILVSGSARRAPFLWAVLPAVAIAVFEKIAFGTAHFGWLIQNRLFGFSAAAFDLTDKNGVPVDPHFIPINCLAPGRFLANPGLWLGLLVAALFLAAAVRIRRYRAPL
jgi:ABC-2 type transport system permease protein